MTWFMISFVINEVSSSFEVKAPIEAKNQQFPKNKYELENLNGDFHMCIHSAGNEH